MKLNFFPVVKDDHIEINSQTWKISLYENDLTFLKKENEWDSGFINTIKYYLNYQKNNFRVQIIVKGIPYLVAFHFENHELILCGPRLFREFNLIREFETKGIQDEMMEEFSRFKSHVERVASLDSDSFPLPIDFLEAHDELVDFKDEKFKSLDEKASVLTKKLAQELKAYKPSLFEKFSDFGLDLTARFALIRIHLLKFLAILPSLDYDQTGVEVKKILLETFRRSLEDSKKYPKHQLPLWLVISLWVAHTISKVIPAGLLATIVRYKVRLMAKRFIAGEDIVDATESLKEIRTSKRDATLDQLGELVVSNKEADEYLNKVLELIHGQGNIIAQGDKNKAGINRAHISIKVSALANDFNPVAYEYTYEQIAPRLLKILEQAHQKDVFINIDAEHYHYRDIVLKIYGDVLCKNESLKDYDQTGIVLQAYLRDAYKHLKDIIELAKKRKHVMPIRLVKGAYWDAETIEAEAHAFDAPQFLNKEETDIHFRQIAFVIMKEYPHVQLTIASHNIADHAYIKIMKEQFFPKHPELEHQCLHMTYEALSVGMAKLGWTVRNYVPVGSLLVGMAYLVRRIMENSSQVGILTQMRSHFNIDTIRTPHEILVTKRSEHQLDFDSSINNLDGNFFNITPLKTYKDEELEAFKTELDYFSAHSLGLFYGDQNKYQGKVHDVLSSSDESISVGKIKFANHEDALEVIKIADEAYLNSDWSNLEAHERSAILLNASDLLLKKRNELSALIMYEAGKTINEALADIDEAIDFINFYVHELLTTYKNKENLKSRGAVAAITPWNFPVAIPCGMITGPLVMGNTVILKSAEQTPLSAQALVDIFHQAGIPEDILIHLPGQGEVVGKCLVEHERISSIVFTGSKAVGTYISDAVKNRMYENKKYQTSYPVRVVTEMGGKNAIIVTSTAELDETVSGILYSAFGHAGQKCSAASRVIIDNKVKDRFIERFVKACEDIQVGKAYDFSTYINPLIEKDVKDRLILDAIEIENEAQAHNGKMVINRAKDDLPGYCIGPVVAELPASRVLNEQSYAQRELFAPVVHIIGYNGLNQALEIFNSTPYALTGGVFCQSQDDIDTLVSKMECGNLYVNRPNTGARVAIEPFGGFKLSGTGPKAGSSDYLRSFAYKHDERKDIEIEAHEEGSEYAFDLSENDLTSINKRKDQLCMGLENFIKKFDNLYQGIFEVEKEELRDVKAWLHTHLHNFFQDEHPNRKIPGQSSYNDFSMGKQGVLFVAESATPSIYALKSLIAALAMGSGITVITRNQKLYALWSSIAAAFTEMGLAKKQFNVYIATEGLLKKSLKRVDVNAIIFDTSFERVQELTPEVEYLQAASVKKCLHQYDPWPFYDMKDFLLMFTEVRSFAVNTMRHGAPLELEA